MNPITVLFYALATFLGVENELIVSKHVTVTINPAQKNIEIVQKDLFALIVSPEDSIAVYQEFQKILSLQQNLHEKDANGLTIKAFTFSQNGSQLDATLTISYEDDSWLEKTGLYFDAPLNKLSLINLPNWNIQSKNAVLNGNYWDWDNPHVIIFTLEPFKNLPEQLQKYQKSAAEFLRK